MAAKKVFISYDHSEDLRYKNLLRAWHGHAAFEFEFDQRSPNLPINSEDGAKVKQSLTRMMKGAKYLLVIVGKKSHKSKWMNWEIERAKMSDTKLKLVAVKIERSYITPAGLLGCGTAFAMGFEHEKILEALSMAGNNY